eukprot:Trichotokara_eunicae@DN4501_c0_g1_i1.p1
MICGNRNRVCVGYDPAGFSVSIGGKIQSTLVISGVYIACFVFSIIHGEGFSKMSENPMLGPSPMSLLTFGGLWPPAVTDGGEVWRLFTAPLLHAGLFHLVMNLPAFLVLGIILEPDWGAMKFLWVWLASSFTGALASCIFSPAMSVGCSGALHGLTAAVILYTIEYKSSIRKPFVLFVGVVITLIFGIVLGFLPAIDGHAHWGGSVGGLLAAGIFLKKIDRTHSNSKNPHRSFGLRRVPW